jgi:hypothetical protein
MAKTVTAGIIVAKMGIAPVWPLAVVLAAALAGAVDPARAADPFVREELRIPLPEARPNGLEALLVRPAEPGR